LVIALLSNLFVLPSLLLSLDKKLITKAFREPVMEGFDEEEDAELDQMLSEELPPEDQEINTHKKQ